MRKHFVALSLRERFVWTFQLNKENKIMKTSWIMPGILAFVVVTLGIMFSVNSVLAQTTEGHHPANEKYWNQFRGPSGDGKALATEYWASPLYADGKIYFFSKEGKVSVISAAREFQLLAENEFDASFIASPAVAGNAIILRSLTHLYCIEK